jgi:hypothetical protein
MTQRLVYIQNRVNNAAIQRTKNERGDLIYIVPSYTLPDNVVMNGIKYPADEIANSFHSLEDTPAPVGHPYDADGNYITANSPDGILYFQCGIFNKNVKRVECEKYGHRVYVEKHIHVETAMKSERGKAVINAIDKNMPVHTSTGILMDVVNVNGEDTATGMIFDHDAILLDEDGAATPADGVGLMVNTALLTSVNRDNKQLTVNSSKLDVNQSFNDKREILQTKLQKKFGDDDTHIWMQDFGEDYAVFESKESSYKVKYMQDDNGNIMIGDEAEEVKRITLWESVAAAVKSVFTTPFNNERETTTNQSKGNSMITQEHVEKVLKANSIDFSAMSDDEKVAAYEGTFKANAAGTKEGEQSNPETVTAEQVAEIVANALKAQSTISEQGTRTELAEKLKANGVELTETEQKAMSVNSLQSLVSKTSPNQGAYGLAGGQIQTNSADDDLSDTLPE